MLKDWWNGLLSDFDFARTNYMPCFSVSSILRVAFTGWLFGLMLVLNTAVAVTDLVLSDYLIPIKLLGAAGAFIAVTVKNISFTASNDSLNSLRHVADSIGILLSFLIVVIIPLDIFWTTLLGLLMAFLFGRIADELMTRLYEKGIK